MAANRRTDERHSVDLPVTLRAYRMTPIETRMVDVSAGGAMLALPGDAVERGDEMVLAGGGVELVATVAWCTEEFCGLSFHRRLHASEVAAFRRARAAH